MTKPTAVCIEIAAKLLGALPDDELTHPLRVRAGDKMLTLAKGHVLPGVRTVADGVIRVDGAQVLASLPVIDGALHLIDLVILPEL